MQKYELCAYDILLIPVIILSFNVAEAGQEQPLHKLALGGARCKW